MSEEREHPADSRGRALWDPRITGFNLSTLAHHLFSCSQFPGSFNSLGPSQTNMQKKKMYLGGVSSFDLKSDNLTGTFPQPPCTPF